MTIRPDRIESVDRISIQLQKIKADFDFCQKSKFGYGKKLAEVILIFMADIFPSVFPNKKKNYISNKPNTRPGLESHSG
jgi:hypothetical protein